MRLTNAGLRAALIVGAVVLATIALGLAGQLRWLGVVGLAAGLGSLSLLPAKKRAESESVSWWRETRS